ncbi:hypothetical protein ABT169_15875 [Streptomyces sp. NPDC001616]|uniref:hypothetical protein n=1 Tax=Streptomyces sp. NPDC001616 TaxID=3156648 RepID=UPI003329871B
MPQVDTRLVQTAVLGSRGSEQPVILPEESHNLDEFRRQFGTDRFWCGTLLGGCGEKLMTKRYENKVCHFSHYPAQDGSRSACHRSANGVDSADHLFIKMHVKEWLAQQGHAAQAELQSLGAGPGDAVDFWLRATEQHVRFELHPQDYRSWRRAADSLGVKEGHVEWVFGPEGPITRDMIARQGYALRVRCETEGTDRKVFIGTVTEKKLTDWAPLHLCRMTTEGIVTPLLEELRTNGTVRAGGLRNTPFPASLPLRAAELVFARDPSGEPPLQSALTRPGRYLVPGFIKPAASRIVRTYLSLPDDIPAPSEQHVYRLSGVARLMITDPLGNQGSAWAVHTDGLIRLGSLEAERTGLWRPSVSLPDQIAALPPRDTTPRPTPALAIETAPRITVADQIREELKKVATERTTITWDELALRTGLDLTHLPDPKRRDLLVEVDTPLSAESPLLCVLVLTPSGRHPFYLGTVLSALGAQPPGSEFELRGWTAHQRDRTHDIYCPRTAIAPPSRPALQVAIAPTRPQPHPGAGWDVPPPADLRAASRTLKKLRLSLSDATSIHSWAADSARHELAGAMERATHHLDAYDTARRSAAELREWTAAAALLISGLKLAMASLPAAHATPRKTTEPPLENVSAPHHTPAVTGREADPTATHADPATSTEPNPAHDEARAQFQALIDLILAAQAGDDVRAVDTGRRLAGPIYAQRLSATDRDRYTPFMRDVKAWCLQHTPKSHVDPPLQKIRDVLAGLNAYQGTLPLTDLRREVRELGKLQRILAEPLNVSDEGAVRRWRSRLAHRERTETERVERPATQPSGVRKKPSAPGTQEAGLPLETIDKLAAAARQVLIDQARSGGRLLTWGELRHRMGGALPHLVADDQGELLVSVDQETPADEPLLSTLIASGDTSLHWLYRHVRFSLGRGRIPDEELESHWAAEVLRLRQVWRYR